MSKSSDGGSDDDEKTSPREWGKKRITLAFEGAPLALPTDPVPPKDPEAAATPPPATPKATLDSAATDPDDSVHDGWSRDRVSRGSGVHRAVTPSVAPPPEVGTPAEWEEKSDALELVDRRRPSEPSLDLAAEVTERFALDDFTGALRAAELLLGRVPEHEQAKRYAALCRERLFSIYIARLGALSAIPALVIEASDVRWLGLDHRAGFLLSQVDGVHTVEQLIDISGMPKLEALKTLAELLDAGTIAV